MSIHCGTSEFPADRSNLFEAPPTADKHHEVIIIIIIITIIYLSDSNRSSARVLFIVSSSSSQSAESRAAGRVSEGWEDDMITTTQWHNVNTSLPQRQHNDGTTMAQRSRIRKEICWLNTRMNFKKESEQKIKMSLKHEKNYRIWDTHTPQSDATLH